jgi:histidine triad (HIT) family protein
VSGCIFCEIVAGRALAYRLVEDEHTLAFLNIAPATVGHALVVPRRHAEGLWDLGDEDHARVARATIRTARLLRVALAPAGVNLVHATGTAAWQSVFHFHVHVVPRYRPEELQVMWEADRAPDGDLEALRRRILTAGAPLLEDQAGSRPAGAAMEPG